MNKRIIGTKTISSATQPGARRDAGQELDAIIDEIDAMIGLGTVKHELNRLIAFAQVIAMRRERDIPVGAINLHMVFTGPPGTGKTVMARKVGRIFKAIGLLKKGHVIEVDRSKLVGSYMGETAKLVTESVKDALDGVLFIDEAYTLAGADRVHGADQYGKEAVDTLLKLMEDNRERLVVIAAGYTSEMRRFVESNPGLKSRFSRFIEFPSYDPDELLAIFLSMVQSGHYTLDPDARELARKHIAWMSKTADETFGNARAVRAFFERILPIQAERIAFLPDLEDLSDEALLKITATDVEAATQD